MLCIICNLQESDANAGRFHGASGISSDDYFGRSTQKSKLFAHLSNCFLNLVHALSSDTLWYIHFIHVVYVSDTN